MVTGGTGEGGGGDGGGAGGGDGGGGDGGGDGGELGGGLGGNNIVAVLTVIRSVLMPTDVDRAAAIDVVFSVVCRMA